MEVSFSITCDDQPRYDFGEEECRIQPFSICCHSSIPILCNCTSEYHNLTHIPMAAVLLTVS